MTDILLRAEFREPVAAHRTLAEYVWPWVKEQTAQGRELVAEFKLLEDDITDKQRGYLHGVVLTEIALYARPNGQQYPVAVWKEWYRSELLGFKVVTAVNPFTGKKSRRRVRVSTEDLGIRAMADYIDRVIAHAATELGVQVSEPLPPELRPRARRQKAVQEQQIDPSTGEILMENA